MQLTSVQRKVVYLGLLLVLAIVIFNLGAPSRTVVEPSGAVRMHAGGLLARMRADMELAEAQLGEIDPSSTTMKLATFGMRGVAISVLWYQTNEYEKREDWNNVIATGNQIVLLEPHFTKIWEFLSWKFSYNGSASFDDYRERYRWVIRGFDFLNRGLAFNKTAPKLFKAAGWTISQKIGIADENEQYRRLLREDTEFGNRYDCVNVQDRDNWMLGRRWYAVGEDLVTRGYSIGKESDFLFFSHSRINLFNYATWVRKDGKFGDEAKNAWANAGEEWGKFSMMDLSTAIDDKITGKPYRSTLHKLDEILEEEAGLTAELNALSPGLFKELCLKRWEVLGETEGQQAALLDHLVRDPNEDPTNKDPNENVYATIREHLDATEPDWRERLEKERDALFTPEQLELKKIPALLRDEVQNGIVSKGDEQFQQIVARSVEIVPVTPQVVMQELQEIPELPGEKKARARSIIQTIDSHAIDRRMSSLYQGILNYKYRNQEYVIEQQQEVDDAKRMRHVGRAAYYGGEYLKSAQLWLDAMDKWNELFHKPGFEYVEKEPTYNRELQEMLEKFVIILDTQNELFPEKFGLQGIARREMMVQNGAGNVLAAQDYAQDVYEKGDLEKAREFFRKIISSWNGMNYSKEYMKLAPLPDFRDKMLAALGTYITILEKRGEPVPDDLPLLSYAELMLRYDAAPRVGSEAVRRAAALFEQKKYAEAEPELLQAIDEWKKVLAKYPMIRSRTQLPIRAEIAATYRLYEQNLKAQDKTAPADYVPFP